MTLRQLCAVAIADLHDTLPGTPFEVASAVEEFLDAPEPEAALAEDRAAEREDRRRFAAEFGGR